ncbi:hypothetical protein [Streptomyces kronopolitis]|uniref:hypothetical protein n=1 Tax=Streptomyces kronopolitis TaxID=1612435 RepID=UPI003D956758
MRQRDSNTDLKRQACLTEARGAAQPSACQRRVTARDQNLGLAYSDTDLDEILRRADIENPQEIIDDPAWVE